MEESEEQCGGGEDGPSFEAVMAEELPIVRPFSARLETVVVTGNRASVNDFWYQDIDRFNDDLERAFKDSDKPGEDPDAQPQPPADPPPEPDTACTLKKVACQSVVETAYSAAIAKCGEIAVRYSRMGRWGGVVGSLVAGACVVQAEYGKFLASRSCDQICN